ncbi:hypothetical protein WMY93_022305 [Mugilogobius chulae]|uniref:Uncharacterized protein n=1 Tax=Mugilogobius chulae TaxID=88201 RepID=A0AAW0N856_9GOBI
MPNPATKLDNGTKVTLEMAQNLLKKTSEGHHKIMLSCMGICHFPTCLLRFDDLEELDLSRNRLIKLPDEFGKLVRLKQLDLHSNNLELLPETILEVLHLGSNRLSVLPESMAEMQKLTKLDLSSNQFRQLPECVQYLSRKTQLVFRGNFIKSSEVKTVGGGKSGVPKLSRRSLVLTAQEKGKMEEKIEEDAVPQFAKPAEHVWAGNKTHLLSISSSASVFLPFLLTTTLPDNSIIFGLSSPSLSPVTVSSASLHTASAVWDINDQF